MASSTSRPYTFPFQVASTVGFTELQFDKCDALHAGTVLTEADIEAPSDWGNLTTAIFGGILTVAPYVTLYPTYAVWRLEAPTGFVFAFSTLTETTPFARASMPRATFHLTASDHAGWSVRCGIRRAGSFDLESVLVLNLDEAGGTLELVID